MTRKLTYALPFLLFFALPLRAQQVRVRGYGEADLDAALRNAVGHAAHIITRDTLIAASDTLFGDVLVLKSRFILEGTVRGRLTGVEANLYLRPPARVQRRVMNIAGGYYPSELARVGSVEDRPLAPYHVLRDGNDYIIEGMVHRPAIKLTGGAQLPEYNRVDGLRLELGPRLLLPPVAGFEPSIVGSIGYATERKDALGRAAVELKRGRSTLSVGWEDDITRTNEDWIRSQLKNSLSTIWNGKDYRNYYEADRTYVEVRRLLERGRRTSSFWLRAQNEIAHPMAAGDPFIVWHPDSIRFNPAVPTSRVTSALFGAESEWHGPFSYWHLAGEVEAAARVGGSDEEFNAYRVQAVYARKAIANHTLEIELNARGPLPGTDRLPLQRWSFVGGSGTLYTYDIGQFRGDRVFFLETEYTIPFAPQLHLPVLGTPKLKLMHNIGMAWSYAQDRDFEQNLGARLQFSVAHVRYIVDPRNGKSKFSVGVSFPSKGYPWERGQR